MTAHGYNGRLLTETDFTDILNVSVRTLQQWRVSGFGPRFIKVGRAVRYLFLIFRTGSTGISTGPPLIVLLSGEGGIRRFYLMHRGWLDHPVLNEKAYCK